MRSLLSNGRVSHQFPVFPLFQDVTILAEHETSSMASDNGNVISQISPIGKWLKGWEGLCLPYLFWPMSEFWLEIGEVGPFISWFQPLRYWGKKCLCNAFRAKGQIDTDTSWLTLCIMMYPMYPLWCVLSMGIWKVAPPMKRAKPPLSIFYKFSKWFAKFAKILSFQAATQLWALVRKVELGGRASWSIPGLMETLSRTTNATPLEVISLPHRHIDVT